MLQYRDSLEGIGPNEIRGFFVDWPNPPTPETHLRALARSDRIVLAIDMSTNHVVGFISAVTDETLSAYIPLLEVLPAYQGQGIGSALVTKMLALLNEIYMVDLTCDPDIAPFYARFGMKPATAMSLRHYDRQSGSG